MKRNVTFDEEENYGVQHHDEYDEDEEEGVEDHFHHTRFYTLLGLRPDCTLEQVQRSYKLLSRVFHPDKAGLSSTAAGIARSLSHELDDSDDDTFIELQRCVEVLSDRILRLAYDMGGTAAVLLLQQRYSQSSPSSQHSEEASSASSARYDGGRSRKKQDANDENDARGSGGGTQNPLYVSMSNAASEEEAVRLLLRALAEFRHDEKQRELHRKRQGRGVSQLDMSIQCPLAGWERESAGLSVTAKKSMAPHGSVAATASHRLQHRGLGQISAGLGCEYLRHEAWPSRSSSSASTSHRSGTSSYAADAWFVLGSRLIKDIWGLTLPSPNWSFRTTRELSSGTVVAAGLSGNLLQKQSWNYSVTSYRYIYLFSRDESSQSDGSSRAQLQALWKCGVQAATGRLGFLVAQLRTADPEAAQCHARFSLTSPYPLKVECRQAAHNTPAGGLAVSVGVGWWNLWRKLKVTWCQRLGRGRITVRYGIKYDGRAAAGLVLLTNGDAVPGGSGSVPLWTVVTHLYTNDLSIRVPIHLTPCAAAAPTAAVWMITLLVSQFLEPLLEDIVHTNHKKSSRGDYLLASTRNSISQSLATSDPVALRGVADKKRELERKTDGLVVLSVTVDGIQDDVLVDLLQFWTVQSSLNVPVAEIRDFFVNDRDVVSGDDVPWPWRTQWSWQSLFSSLRKSTRGPPDANATRTDSRHTSIRYQYRGWSYESVFDEHDERILIPNNSIARTTRLGRRDIVF
jgi:curved DNA-binding protein CbpA